MNKPTLNLAADVTAAPIRTYEDYLADGRIWGAEKLAAAVWKNGSHDVESLARVYADINAPRAVRAEHFARKSAERAAEFGPSAAESGRFVLGQYGLRKVAK